MVQQNIHGGDIYRNQVSLDFSVNINPFGMPQRVREALEAAVAWCERYPQKRCCFLYRHFTDMSMRQSLWEQRSAATSCLRRTVTR